jgi:hypothetical protein
MFGVFYPPKKSFIGLKNEKNGLFIDPYKVKFNFQEAGGPRF